MPDTSNSYNTNSNTDSTTMNNSNETLLTPQNTNMEAGIAILATNNKYCNVCLGNLAEAKQAQKGQVQALQTKHIFTRAATRLRFETRDLGNEGYQNQEPSFSKCFEGKRTLEDCNAALNWGPKFSYRTCTISQYNMASASGNSW